MYLGRRANKNYSRYQQAESEGAASRYFARSRTQATLSDGLIITGAAAWATDVALVIIKGIGNKKAKKAILNKKSDPVSHLYYDPVLKSIVLFNTFRL
jgi:hypothetical protein